MVSVLQTKELPTWAVKCVFLQYFKLLELLNWHTDMPSLCHFLCLKWLIPTVGKGRTGLGKSSFHFQISYPEMSSFPEAFPPVIWVDHASHHGRGGGRTRELAPCKMSDLNGSKAWSIYQKCHLFSFSICCTSFFFFFKLDLDEGCSPELDSEH